MQTELQVKLLSPARVVLEAKASHVSLPGLEGYMGILPGHTDLLSELGQGALTIDKTDGSQETFEVAGGYAEVHQDLLTILADQVT